MALRFVSMLLCTIFAIGSALALPPPPPSGNCGQNAERQTCGSACAPTCANPNPGPICVLPCVDSCFCKVGYLKTDTGACVRPEECDSVHRIPNMPPQFNAVEAPPKCGVDEEYRTCGSACIPTCAMPLPRPWCTRHCAVGCYCKEGYLRNEQNVCIPATKCKSAAAQGPINIPLFKGPPTRSGPSPFLPLGPGPVIIPSQHVPILPLEPGPVIFPSPHVALPPFEPGPVIFPSPQMALPPLEPGPVIFPSPQMALPPFEPGPVIFPSPQMALPPLEPGPVIIQENSHLSPINIPLHKVPFGPLCPKDEVYNACGVQLDCLASCKIPMTPKCMERICTPGCVCQKPLVRHEDGRCVEKTQCPKN